MTGMLLGTALTDEQREFAETLRSDEPHQQLHQVYRHGEVSVRTTKDSETAAHVAVRVEIRDAGSWHP